MIDVSSVGNKLQRSIYFGEEVRSGGKGHPDRQRTLQNIPLSTHLHRLLGVGIIELRSQESSGPWRREGDHGKSSSERSFTAKAAAKGVCLLRGERRLSGEAAQTAAEWTRRQPSRKPLDVSRERMRAHAHPRWLAEGLGEERRANCSSR